MHVTSSLTTHKVKLCRVFLNSTLRNVQGSAMFAQRNDLGKRLWSIVETKISRITKSLEPNIYVEREVTENR